MIPIEARILRVASKAVPRECPIKSMPSGNQNSASLNLEIVMRGEESYTCQATVTCMQAKENNGACIGCALRVGKSVSIEQFSN